MAGPGVRIALLMAVGVALGGCAEATLATHAMKSIPGAERGYYKVGTPYQIKGVWYYPAEDYDYDETGIASWYGPDFHKKETANGEIFDMNAITAAHRTLPMPSFVRVTNLENGRAIVVRVNDRGPYAQGRIIDLSRRSAQLLGMEGQGTAKVRVQILAEESRAIAARLQNREPEDGRPAPVAAPRVAVAAETLPPPGSREAPRPVQTVAARPQERVAPAAAEPTLETQRVQVVPVKATTSVYVQAGSYRNFDNANRASAKLSPLGRIAITQAMVNGSDVYRVRMGPVTNTSDADRLLEMVIAAGYPDARVVVD